MQTEPTHYSGPIVALADSLYDQDNYEGPAERLFALLVDVATQYVHALECQFDPYGAPSLAEITADSIPGQFDLVGIARGALTGLAENLEMVWEVEL